MPPDGELSHERADQKNAPSRSAHEILRRQRVHPLDRLPLAQATVSQHLKVLKDAGLIHGEIDPPRVCYCVNPDVLRRLKTLIGDL